MTEYGMAVEIEDDADEFLIQHLLQFNFDKTCQKHPELKDYWWKRVDGFTPEGKRLAAWYVDTEEQHA